MGTEAGRSATDTCGTASGGAREPTAAIRPNLLRRVGGFLIYTSGRLVPKFGRSWHGVVVLVLFTPAVLAPILQTLGVIASPRPRLITAYAVVATALGAILRLHLDYERASAGEREQEVRVHEAEKRAEGDLAFNEFVKAQLRLVVERANLLMVKAEGRANMRYGVATILTVTCVLVPVAAVAVYVLYDPLAPSVAATLASLTAGGASLSKGVTVAISTERDWHILLAGMSFGFLFLAASAALFAQHRRQMDTVVLLAADVDYFNRVVAGVDIASRSDAPVGRMTMPQVADGVIAMLLEKPANAGRSEQQTEPSVVPVEHAKTLIELLKQLRA